MNILVVDDRQTNLYLLQEILKQHNELLARKLEDKVRQLEQAHRGRQRDITERKRAEAELAQLAAIVESSNDAIITRGTDRTILSWNAAAERLFGWSAQEAVGRPVGLIVPPERQGVLQRFIERTERGEPIRPVEAVLEGDGAVLYDRLPKSTRLRGRCFARNSEEWGRTQGTSPFASGWGLQPYTELVGPNGSNRDQSAGNKMTNATSG